MSNNPIDNSKAADQLLHALAEQLSARGESYTLAVVGGSALLALGLVTRTTKDVDILAIVEDHELVSAQPLPAALLDAAHTVARDFGLSDDWLNPGPTSLLDAARWSRSHDPSDDYLSVLNQVLAHFGAGSGNLDP